MEDHIAKYQKLEGNDDYRKRLTIINDKPDLKMESFSIDESKIKNNSVGISNNKIINTDNSNSNNAPHPVIAYVKQLSKDFISSPTVRTVANPFSDTSEECQTCYKICATILIAFILFLVYLMFAYK